MKNFEILAPVGGKDALIAAVRSGTNAVYLGTKFLNARRNASNFSFEELEEVVSYCHSRNVKVYITLNTIMSDEEINKAISVIKCGCAIGADAFIIQDLGLYSLIKKTAPEMPIHASTQMSIQTTLGVDTLSTLGFSRVILPREMSLEEITNICKNSKIDVEVFVHGALCMCVSGQCYMSAMLGSRSGNRGLCAQPCRLPFKIEGGTGHDLSLKDLCIVQDIPKLKKAGVKSFKIEGRMKRPEYVAACVTACKQSNENNGIVEDELNQNLKAVFSRSGFTKGYLESKLGKDMFGTRQKEDVTSAPAALSKLTSLYRKEIGVLPVDFALNANLGENLTLTASCKGVNIFEKSEFIVTKAENKSTDIESIKKQLKKCGSTAFFANDIFIDMDENVHVPLSSINAIRRTVLEKLELEICKPNSKEFKNFNINFNDHKSKNLSTIARFSHINQIPSDLQNVKTVIIPLYSTKEKVVSLINQGLNVGVEIPRGIFSTEFKILQRLEEAKNHGVKFAYCGTLDAVAIAKKVGIKILGGFSLNVYNTLSLYSLKQLGVNLCTLSPEITLQQAKHLGCDIPRGIISYGRLPLMLTRNCPVKNARDCCDCDKNAYLTDRLGVKFPVVCNNGFSEILNSRPIYMAERIKELENLDFMILYFTKESTKECFNIIKKYQTGEKYDGEFTRGLYYRGVE